MSTDKKHIGEWTKKELLSLPVRNWGSESIYDSVLLLSTGRKHDSGWAMIAIIGVIAGDPIELATTCSDDIEWISPAPITYGPNGKYSVGQIRMDCARKSGAMQAWSYDSSFKVGMALSSINIELIPRVKERP